MASKAGYIKLYRQLSDNWLWNSSEPFDQRSAWIDLLMMANFAPSKVQIGGKVVTIQRGQIQTTLGYLQKRWRWGHSRLRSFFGRLIGDGMITAVGNAVGMTLTIENYGKWQGAGIADGIGDGIAAGIGGGIGAGIHNKKNKEERRKEEARSAPRAAASNTFDWDAIFDELEKEGKLE